MTQRYDTYKDSGVQWLGEIPGHWGCSKVMYFFDVQLGKMLQPHPKCLSDKQTDYLCAIHVGKNTLKLSPERKMWASDEDLVQYGIKKGDLLVVEGGDVGSCAIVKEDINGYIIQNALHRVRSKNTCKVDYLQYLLNTAKYNGHFEKICSKATIAHFTKEKLQSFNISLHPLSEQHAIVSYLDGKCRKIDEWIEKKQKEVELLGEMKQRVIADAVTRGLPSTSLGQVHAKMKQTNIPWLSEVPEHWEEKRLASLFTGDIEANKDFQYKRAFKFYYGSLVPKNEIGDPEEYRDVYVKYSIVDTGDILINGLNLNYDFVSQRVAYAPSKGIITSAYVVCRPRPNVNYEYYTFLFKAIDNMKLFHGMGTGIRLTLSFKELKKQILPVPPLSEQRAIVSYITERTAKIDKMVENVNKEIEALKEYKQRLISDVVTGQIKVC